MEEVCDDGVDNDGDRDIDCNDADCLNDIACVGSPVYAAPADG